MEQVRQLEEDELRKIRSRLDADVAAVAWQRKTDGGWAWQLADGCADDRYRTLTIRMGRGLEGTVPRIGRPLIVDEAHVKLQDKREESPFMLVEKLKSAIAYPIAGSEGVRGVLLVGNRDARRYSTEHLLTVQIAARRLSELSDYREMTEKYPVKSCHDIME